MRFEPKPQWTEPVPGQWILNLAYDLQVQVHRQDAETDGPWRVTLSIDPLHPGVRLKTNDLDVAKAEAVALARQRLEMKLLGLVRAFPQDSTLTRFTGFAARCAPHYEQRLRERAPHEAWAIRQMAH
jgi:hypothetical protein